MSPVCQNTPVERGVRLQHDRVLRKATRVLGLRTRIPRCPLSNNQTTLLNLTFAFLLISSSLAQGSKRESEESQASKSGSGTESRLPAPTSAPDSQATQQRLQLNLLGQTDTASGEGRRNENVQ